MNAGASRIGDDRGAAHEADADIGGALTLAGDELPVADGGGDRVDEDGVASAGFDVFDGAVGGDGHLDADRAADVHLLEDFGIGRDDLFQELGLIFLRRVFLRHYGRGQEGQYSRETECGSSVQEEFG
jgi:hypothetical protein